MTLSFIFSVYLICLVNNMYIRLYLNRLIIAFGGDYNARGSLLFRLLGTPVSAPAGRSVDICIIAKFIKPFITSIFV